MTIRSRPVLGLVVGLAVFGLALSFCAGRYVTAAAPGLPGSQSDPLVTQSYVDQQTQWQIVSLAPGQQIVALAGTEIILRAGGAKAVASAGGGLADVTAGRDLAQGAAIAGNHLLIVPKSDGRGVLAVSACVLMVKGAYTVQ